MRKDNHGPENSASNETQRDGLLTATKRGDKGRLGLFKLKKHNVRAYESLREQGKETRILEERFN